MSDTDPNEYFMALVRQMRDAQQIYFRHRSQDALRNAKALESRVDALIEKHCASTRPQQESFL